MPKGEQRSNREKKKPKQPAKPVAPHSPTQRGPSVPRPGGPVKG
jgi:hypothetical protein